VNRKELNDDIAQILIQLGAALQAESIKGAQAFILRASRQCNNTLAKMQGKDQEI
jgi:hypothetical protein